MKIVGFRGLLKAVQQKLGRARIAALRPA